MEYPELKKKVNEPIAGEKDKNGKPISIVLKLRYGMKLNAEQAKAFDEYQKAKEKHFALPKKYWSVLGVKVLRYLENPKQTFSEPYYKALVAVGRRAIRQAIETSAQAAATKGANELELVNLETLVKRRVRKKEKLLAKAKALQEAASKL